MVRPERWGVRTLEACAVNCDTSGDLKDRIDGAMKRALPAAIGEQKSSACNVGPGPFPARVSSSQPESACARRALLHRFE